jgi:hypothetical protein
MEKVFFSNNNCNNLLNKCKANGFGNNLKALDLLEIIKPRMIFEFKRAKKGDTIMTLNERVIGYYLNTSQRLPSPVRFRKNEKISQQDMQTFLNKRNEFDLSVGLKPVAVSLTKPKPPTIMEETETIDTQDPLDAFFSLPI